MDKASPPKKKKEKRECETDQEMPPLSHVSISTARRTTDNSPLFLFLDKSPVYRMHRTRFFGVGIWDATKDGQKRTTRFLGHAPEKKEGELEISENLHGRWWDVIRKVEEGNLRRITMALRAIIKPGTYVVRDFPQKHIK